MKLIAQFLFILLVVTFLVSCSGGSNSPNGSSPSNVVDQKGDFLDTFGEKEFRSSDRQSAYLSKDGSIKFVTTVNRYCKLVHYGQIDAVSLSENYYSIQYRYLSLRNESDLRSCSSVDYNCSLDLQDCERAMGQSQSQLNREHVSFIAKEKVNEELVLLP